ncbi:N-acetylmuramoyl-L-alanine amidase [Patescibacteria group bacterium]|nr:N-acetylmuramoyl-L-alanine amidase [Patescibacteria group bacterium]MCG2695310.1 N-acetylmuramoyl-L-alanine amidase [Candidatus Parcubacteria bacterium]
MKKNIFAGVVLLLTVLIAGSVVADTSSIDGKLIALDAGHGGDYTGGYNINYYVAEKDVNLSVVYSLKSKLESAGATVVLTREGDETILSRSERVDIAIAKCIEIANRECDILVSVHHNGSLDSDHNGTLTIYNEKQDVALAQSLHDTLVPLTGIDEGYLNGGYGITVYDHLISTLTEAYYITNDEEATTYLTGVEEEAGETGYFYLTGERIEEEANAQFQGIGNYFTAMENVAPSGKKKK